MPQNAIKCLEKVGLAEFFLSKNEIEISRQKKQAGSGKKNVSWPPWNIVCPSKTQKNVVNDFLILDHRQKKLV